MKKILAILMAVCMIAGLGVTGYADASEFPWGDLNVTNVIIADGVATVPAEPFAGMTGVVSVVLPASVTSVAAGAFADSAVSAVQTAGDPAILADVAAFADAEVTEISAEDFDALAAAVEAAATESSDDFCYDAASGSLLVKGFAKKDATPATNYFVDFGEGGGNGNENVFPIYDENGNQIGTGTVTEVYDDNGNLVGIHIDLAFDDGSSGAQDYAWDQDENMLSEDTVIKDASGNTTFERHTTFDYSEDGSTRTVSSTMTEDGKTTKESWTEKKGDDGTWYTVTPSQDESEVA